MIEVDWRLIREDRTPPADCAGDPYLIALVDHPYGTGYWRLTVHNNKDEQGLRSWGIVSPISEEVRVPDGKEDTMFAAMLAAEDRLEEELAKIYHENRQKALGKLSPAELERKEREEAELVAKMNAEARLKANPVYREAAASVSLDKDPHHQTHER